MRILAILLVLLVATPAPAAPPTTTVTIQATVVASRRPIHRGDRFDVELRTVNTTAARQTFELMSCGWVQHWRSDDAYLRSQPANCDKNVPRTLDLAPGAIDVRTIFVTVQPDAPLGVHTLRLGFTPPSTKTTIWSNSIAATVIDVTREITIEATPSRSTMHRGETSDVSMHLINTTGVEQTFRIMSCSWPEHWQTDDAQITIPRPTCKKNGQTSLELAPGGGEDTRMLRITVLAKAALGVHTLRFGWKPIHAKTVTWSEPVSIQVDAAP